MTIRAELNTGGFSWQDDDKEGKNGQWQGEVPLTEVAVRGGEGRALLGPLRKDLMRRTEIDDPPPPPHFTHTSGDVTKLMNCCQSDEHIIRQT